MRTPEGIILAGEIWAETGDKSPPAFSIPGGYPLTMSQPVTFAILAGGTITATVGDFIALAATAFGKCTVDGITAEFNLDFTSVTTFDEIATEFQTKMVAAGLPVTVIFDVPTTSLLIRSNTAGVTSTISFFVVPSMGVDVSTIARLTLANGATTTQGQGEFPPREVFNNNQNINTSFAFDGNRYGANLAWDTSVTYEIGAVVIASDNNRYQALEPNTGINPVQGVAVNTDPIASANFVAMTIQGDGDIIAVTDTGTTYRSTDDGASFSLLNSAAFTLGGSPSAYKNNIVAPIFGGVKTDSVQVSNDEGATYSTAGVFFSFSELDTDIDEFIVDAAQSGAGQTRSNNPSFQVVGLCAIGTIINVILFDLDSVTACVISTGLDLSVIGIDLENSAFYLDGNTVYLGLLIPGSGFGFRRLDITDTSPGTGNLEVFNSVPSTEIFIGGFSSQTDQIFVVENNQGNKFLFTKVFKDSTNEQGFVRINVTDANAANWIIDFIAQSTSNVPNILGNNPFPSPYFKNGDFLYFTHQTITTTLNSNVALMRTNINSQVGLNYEWEYFNADIDGFKDDDGKIAFITADNSLIYLLNGGNDDAITDRNVLSKLVTRSQTWRLLNSETVDLESTTESITINQDKRINALDINISPFLLDELEALGNLSRTITVPATSDIVISEIVSKNDPLEKIELIYDFTDDQLKVTNTGANDIQLWYAITAVTTAVGAASNHNPFFVAFGNKTDKQTITPASTGFLTGNGSVDSDLALVATNDRYNIIGHIIFDNGDIVRFEFVECIRLTSTLVKLAGGFIDE